MFDDADALVAEDSAGGAGGYVAFDDVEVGSADSGECDSDNGIRGVGEFGSWTLFEADLPGTFVNESFHDDRGFDDCVVVSRLWDSIVRRRGFEDLTNSPIRRRALPLDI